MLVSDEKRDFIRMQSYCKMQFRMAGSENFMTAYCKNISGSGILFLSDLPLEPGKAAEVFIDPENRITPPLTAYIEIIRCESIHDREYEIAGSIKGIKSS
ncbi:PilZ domain-containing protein [Candidatus Woesearchaeota archaeon]|jgi:hypothetical protein|nr:PilZ domain-containing protein [Candidatus Woesearchaeota archaeon]